MTIEYSKDYLRTLKRITKKRTLSSSIIDSTIALYLEDNKDVRLQLKSIQVLVCICEHDDYDFRNKNC